MESVTPSIEKLTKQEGTDQNGEEDEEAGKEGVKQEKNAKKTRGGERERNKRVRQTKRERWTKKGKRVREIINNNIKK